MKKVVIAISFVVLLLLAAVMIVPLALKNRIGQTLLNKANQSVNASVNYNGYRLTMLKSFPDFTATFFDVSVIGKDNFKGDTLAYIHQISATIELKSLLKKEGIMVRSLGVNKSLFNFIVDKNGNVNYDIENSKTELKSQSVEEEDGAKKKTKPLKILLQQIDINDLSVVYTSRESNYEFSVKGINGSLAGEVEGMNTVLDVLVEAPSINYNYGGSDYIKDGQISVETKLLANLDTWEFTFQAGDTKLNNLPVLIDGGFSMPNDSMLFNMNFEVPEISMNQLLELIPDEYQKEMEGVDATGTINFNGTINGLYYNDIYPLIDINFNIVDGKLKYPQLPDELTINELNAKLSKPEGSFDALVVGIQNLSMRVADNPFTMHANFSSLFSDPHLDVAVNGKIDLETLSKVIPMGDLKMKGLMTADASVIGNYSALKNNDFTTFVSKGSVNLSNFYFQNSAVPQGVHVQNAALVLQNQDVKVNGLQGNIGRSDFSIKGQLNHLITYIFADDELEGRFVLSSNLIDGNEFLARSPQTRNATELPDSATVEEKPLEFPKKMHLNFDAHIAKLLFDKMDITKFEGSLELKNQLLTLRGLSMNMLDGTLKMDGTVLADGRQYPDVVFGLNVDGFDLPAAYRDISMVHKYLPIAAKSQGEFSTILNVKSKLASDLKMIVSTISANGKFSTKNVRLNDPSILSGLRSVIQYQKLKNLTIDDFTTNYSIENGNLNLKPFDTKLAGQPMKIGGTYNLGGTLDFRLDATLDKEILAEEIQSIITYIPGNQNLKKVDVGVDITGDAKKPDVKVDTDKIKKQVINQVKNSTKEELQDAAKKLLKNLFK